MQYYNKDQIERSYRILKNRYGSHKKAADELGISRDHYRKIRNKRTPMSTCLRKLIILSANQIMNDLMP